MYCHKSDDVNLFHKYAKLIKTDTERRVLSNLPKGFEYLLPIKIHVAQSITVVLTAKSVTMCF